MALYAGLLKGLNLVQQKTWHERELKSEFPELEMVWRPLLEARHETCEVGPEKKRALEILMGMLNSWDNPVEAGLLKRRLKKIAQYFKEAEKKECDAQSLAFFLEDFPLLQVTDLPTITHKEKKVHTLNSSEASLHLQLELNQLFPDHKLKITLSHATLARASTSKKGIRLREDASFTHEELSMLTVHEAWVHLGSNLAGASQKELPWLAHWHPGVTGFQEGLALIAEIATNHWNEWREAQVILRHEAALMALKGSSARQVWSFLCDHGLPSTAALEMTLRVYRGCPLSGGMTFGKEFQYLLGLHQWLARRDELSVADMRVALSGKMDFLEWEILRNGAIGEKLILPSPPEKLLNWMTSDPITELARTLRFRKVA